MNSEQYDFYIDSIRDTIDEENAENTYEVLDNIFFKIKKSAYHFSNIQKNINLSNVVSGEDDMTKDFDEIYYEMESFLISLRSTVDLIMHLINNSLNLGIRNKDVSLSTVHQDRNLPQRVKNVLYQFSHNRDNTIWEFIYSSRNMIVHSTSIKEIYPLTFNHIDHKTVLVAFEVKGKEKELVNFFNSCLNFTERFLLKILESISFVLKNSNH